ncbi:hypothetical protein NQZ79_g935 [Umbelopsis isabellina]|nr:hypothetical protein NQZ79_g935 [Umbelopsis isabellina]
MDEHGFGDRIWRLERLLEDLPAKETVEGEESLESTALYNRLYNLQDALDNCLADDMALRTFIERYGKYEKLLNPSSTSFAVEEELLDSTTKRELILAASSDLESFATQIKQIQSLEHVVESSDISAVDELAVQLRPLVSKHRMQSQEAVQTSKQLTQLMGNYNSIVSFFEALSVMIYPKTCLAAGLR